MIRLIHHEALGSTSPLGITLYIWKLPLGGYNFTYADGSSLFLKSTVIRIPIFIETIGLDDNTTLSVSGHAATGFLRPLLRIGQSEIAESEPSVVSPITVTPHSGGPGEPYAFVDLQMNLNQIIDFGLFVTVTTSSGSQTLFCDPQATNDPRITGTGGLTPPPPAASGP
jgi:hypothetical protein